jgi:hypothetical protein
LRRIPNTNQIHDSNSSLWMYSLFSWKWHLRRKGKEHVESERFQSVMMEKEMSIMISGAPRWMIDGWSLELQRFPSSLASLEWPTLLALDWPVVRM